MEKRQMKDFMGVRGLITQAYYSLSPSDTLIQMYARLVDKCFTDCVDDFTSKSVSAREEGCVFRCWEKNMKAQERIQLRFAEFNEQMMAANN